MFYEGIDCKLNMKFCFEVDFKRTGNNSKTQRGNLIQWLL